jgi:hypothetical protein
MIFLPGKSLMRHRVKSFMDAKKTKSISLSTHWRIAKKIQDLIREVLKRLTFSETAVTANPAAFCRDLPSRALVRGLFHGG